MPKLKSIFRFILFLSFNTIQFKKNNYQIEKTNTRKLVFLSQYKQKNL